jgi:hypothetical protein
MNDDLIGKVAEAIRVAQSEWRGGGDGEWHASLARAAVAATIDGLVARGGVTLGDVYDVVAGYDRGSAPEQQDAIRALVAAAVAHAEAPLRAEVERLNGRRGPDNEAWHEGRKHGSDEAHAAHRIVTDGYKARAEAAEAALAAERERVARVEALIEGWADDVRPARTRTPAVIVTPHPNAPAREALRAALDGER